MKIKYQSEKNLIPHYDQNINYSSPINGKMDEIFNLFQIDLEPYNICLDVGCGTGHACNYVLNKGCDVVGIDYSTERILQANILDGLFIAGDIYSILPLLSNNLFDLIMIFEVLEHLENPNKILKQCRRVLHPQGMIIGSLPINSYYKTHLQIYSGKDDIESRLNGVEVIGFMGDQDFAFFKSMKKGD